MNLLTTKNTKIMKGREHGYMVFGLHLLPGQTCHKATAGCLKACLNTAGHGRYRNVQEARARKTKFFWTNIRGFLTLLHEDIGRAIRRAEKKKLISVFRLNLTSDIPWELFDVPQSWPEYQFYDYSKDHDRFPPKNYHLTFSRSESLQNHIDAKKWLVRGGNVAVVFKKEFPSEYWGHKVVTGEKDDLRFLDPKPAIIGLKAKGKAKFDKSGFVVEAS